MRLIKLFSKWLHGDFIIIKSLFKNNWCDLIQFSNETNSTVISKKCGRKCTWTWFEFLIKGQAGSWEKNKTSGFPS